MVDKRKATLPNCIKVIGLFHSASLALFFLARLDSVRFTTGPWFLTSAQFYDRFFAPHLSPRTRVRGGEGGRGVEGVCLFNACHSYNHNVIMTVLLLTDARNTATPSPNLTNKS